MLTLALFLFLQAPLTQPAPQALRCQIDLADHYWHVEGFSPELPKPVRISMRPEKDRMKAFKDCHEWLKQQEKKKK